MSNPDASHVKEPLRYRSSARLDGSRPFNSATPLLLLYRLSLLLAPYHVLLQETPQTCTHFHPLLSFFLSPPPPLSPGLWYQAICVSCASTPFFSSQPRAPDPPRAPPPSTPPLARRWLCRLISSEIGELQARAHMHRHFSYSKRHFRH